MRIVFLVVASISLFIFVGVVLAIEIYIEAENANELIEPMKVFSDDKNAWGKYIEGRGGGGGSAFARYEINMPQAGKFYIWGRARSFDAGTNSFHFQLNDSKNLVALIWDLPDEHPEPPKAFCEEWCWDIIAHRPGKEPFEFKFKKGKNNLYIVVREPRAGLDALYIVPDPEMEPPKKPLPEGFQAVEPHFKLSATWGKIKQEVMQQLR